MRAESRCRLQLPELSETCRPELGGAEPGGQAGRMAPCGHSRDGDTREQPGCTPATTSSHATHPGLCQLPRSNKPGSLHSHPPSDLPHALRSLAFLLPATAATSPCLLGPHAPHGLFPHGASPTASFPTAPHRPSATTAPCAPRKGEGGGRRGSHLSVGCPAGTPRGCQGAEARPVPHGARPGVRWQQGKRQSPPRLVPGLALQCGAV